MPKFTFFQVSEAKSSSKSLRLTWLWKENVGLPEPLMNDVRDFLELGAELRISGTSFFHSLITGYNLSYLQIIYLYQ